MLRTQAMPNKIHDGLGFCLVCLNSSDKLTEEHIVPRSLSGIGELSIRGGTCEACNGGMNERFENPALQNDLLLLRAFLDLKRRKKRPLQKPPPVKVLNERGQEVEIEIPWEDYPPLANILIPDVAGRLANLDRGSNLDSLQMWTVNLSPKGKTWPKIATRLPCIAGALPLLIAKVGYMFAVVNIGIDAFDGDDIRELLRGERSDFGNFVGKASVDERIPRRHFHEMFVKRRGEWVTVEVVLFASYGAPAWEVVVGRALK